jgi:hypothetical protein
VSYNRTILTRFGKCIEIMNGKDYENKMIGIKIRNNSRRIKNTTNYIQSDTLLLINKRDLLTVLDPTE